MGMLTLVHVCTSADEVNIETVYIRELKEAVIVDDGDTTLLLNKVAEGVYQDDKIALNLDGHSRVFLHSRGDNTIGLNLNCKLKGL